LKTKVVAMTALSTLRPTPLMGILLALCAGISLPLQAADAPAGAASAPARAALAVTLVQAQASQLPLRVAANGNIAAWQEASIGAQANGLRLTEVRANVGDVVQRGEVLARFAADTVQAELAQAEASVAEAQAALADATANAARARELQNTGALSAQQINQYLTAEKTARARLDAQRALTRSQSLRLQQTQVLAPDAGVISARSATVGAVVPAGQELFRLIRQGRLEWRAEVQAADLASLQPGMAVTLTPAGGQPVAGKLRKVAPTVDAATRNGIVYVDLIAPGSARAGMFARGEFVLGQSQALTLPQSAVQLRDGFAFVMQLGAANKVAQRKVVTGRRLGDRIEIVSGLAAGAQVVASGGAFLSDGDTVRVVPAPATAPAPAVAPAAAPAAAK
jgi:HlyD family secretion protein